MDNSSYFRFDDDNKTKWIFSKSSQGKLVNWTHTAPYNVHWITEKICLILLTHSYSITVSVVFRTSTAQCKIAVTPLTHWRYWSLSTWAIDITKHFSLKRPVLAYFNYCMPPGVIVLACIQHVIIRSVVLYKITNRQWKFEMESKLLHFIMSSGPSSLQIPSGTKENHWHKCTFMLWSFQPNWFKLNSAYLIVN